MPTLRLRYLIFTKKFQKLFMVLEFGFMVSGYESLRSSWWAKPLFFGRAYLLARMVNFCNAEKNRIEWSHLKLRMDEESWRPREFWQALALFTHDSNEGQNLVVQKAIIVCHWVSIFDKGFFDESQGWSDDFNPSRPDLLDEARALTWAKGHKGL